MDTPVFTFYLTDIVYKLRSTDFIEFHRYMTDLQKGITVWLQENNIRANYVYGSNWYKDTINFNSPEDLIMFKLKFA